MTTNGPDNVGIRLPLLLIGPDWIMRDGGGSVIFVDFSETHLFTREARLTFVSFHIHCTPFYS